MSEALLACGRCRYYWFASAAYPPIRAEHCYPAAASVRQSGYLPYIGGRWALRPRLTAGLLLSRRRSACACENDRTNLEASSLSSTQAFFLNPGRLGCMLAGYFRQRTSENSTSTHSGELTLGTWLLQQPTHRDPGPTEHGRDASALQVDLKDPESSLS